MAGHQELDSPAIILCMPTRGRPAVETMASMGAVDGVPTIFLYCPRKGVIQARNELARDCLKIRDNPSFQPKLGWFVLWVDDDAFWQSGTFTKMLQGMSYRHIDVLAGWFSGRAPLSRPKAAKLNGSSPTMDDHYEGRIVEVATIGFHFVMHRAELLEELPENPFEPEGTSALGEDIAFCQRARAIGKRIFVHAGCPVAHIDDDGTAYLPGEPPMRVMGGELVRRSSERDYGDLGPQNEDQPSGIILV